LSERLELLVVGGGPAGFAAADAYREAGGGGAVAIVAAEERMPYHRPLLSKELLRGEVEEAALALADEAWLADRDVRLVSGRAVALDSAQRILTLSGGRDFAYATCLLATGAEPTRLPVPGADDPGVRVLRSLDHLRELRVRLAHGAPVVIIGSGFIGCELAASLRMRDHGVTLVSDEAAPNVARLGDAVASRIRGWLEEEGVEVHLGAAVGRIERCSQGFEVRTADSRAHGELVVMATGVSPRSELARMAGVRVSDDGAVHVDAAMRTSVAGILAAGDLAVAHNAAAGRPVRIEHWGDALGQGKVAGGTAAGTGAEWAEVPGFWSTIGSRSLKYAAWGDGFDDVHLELHADGGFTAWYRAAGRLVGVLAHDADGDYQHGRDLIAEAVSWT
jgi:3-phenylpropionate/trans-cinnamate dioxygenase ferredoxin reductase component